MNSAEDPTLSFECDQAHEIDRLRAENERLRQELADCCHTLDDERLQRKYVMDTYKNAASCNIQVANERAERAEAALAAAHIALCSLTPGGSEYANDPAACVEYVRKTRLSQHEQIMRQIKQNEMDSVRCREMLATARRDALEAALVAINLCILSKQGLERAREAIRALAQKEE